jgi:hypothetical protein
VVAANVSKGWRSATVVHSYFEVLVVRTYEWISPRLNHSDGPAVPRQWVSRLHSILVLVGGIKCAGFYVRVRLHDQSRIKVADHMGYLRRVQDNRSQNGPISIESIRRSDIAGQFTGFKPSHWYPCTNVMPSKQC